MKKADEIAKALDKLDRYNLAPEGMVRRKRGIWVSYEQVKTVVCQAIANAEKEGGR